MMQKKEYSSRKEILAAIAELKSRWPAHSLQPWMIAELEELEDMLENFPVQDPEYIPTKDCGC